MEPALEFTVTSPQHHLILLFLSPYLKNRPRFKARSALAAFRDVRCCVEASRCRAGVPSPSRLNRQRRIRVDDAGAAAFDSFDLSPFETSNTSFVTLRSSLTSSISPRCCLQSSGHLLASDG